jgi:hypothetical protein
MLSRNTSGVWSVMKNTPAGTANCGVDQASVPVLAVGVRYSSTGASTLVLKHTSTGWSVI